MKKIITIALFLLSTYAQSRLIEDAPQKIIDCNYESISSPEFKFSDVSFPWLEEKILYTTKLEPYRQDSKKAITPLLGKKFKAIDTFVNVGMYPASLVTNDFMIDDTPYGVFDMYYSKIITSSCDVFYIGNIPLVDAMIAIQNKNEMPISKEEYLSLMGASVIPLSGINVKYDDFEKMYRIQSMKYKGGLIRAAYSERANRTVMLQYYTTVSGTDSPRIRTALDSDGKSYDVTLIDLDTSCTGASYTGGCRVSETIGVNITEGLLRKSAQKGLRLKLKGRVDRMAEVPPKTIQNFLKELNSAKAGKKN